ncbi:MAG: response regulator transcription factor [Paralcaligenes sp.]
MTTIIVVEPCSLVRLGILRSLDVLAPAISVEASDYSCLFQGGPKVGSTDLVVLSVPDKKEKTIELVNAAEHAFTPKSILLLSDVSALTYMVSDISSVLAGYMAKSSSPAMLVAAVRLILAGGNCFQPTTQPSQTSALHFSVAATAVDSSSVAAATEGSSLVAAEAAMLNLTPRQYEVLVLLARGYPMKMVSRRLNISVATAKTHTLALYQRLQVHTSNAAVYAAFSRGATLGWKENGLVSSASSVPVRNDVAQETRAASDPGGRLEASIAGAGGRYV